MLERLQFLVVYVGSAAVVAFVAACLSSPQVGTFTCHPSGANGSERCELAASLAAIDMEGGALSLESPTPDIPKQAPVTVAASH